MTAAGATTRLRVWRPGVGGVREVLHASFTEHAYPLHTHDTWTLLLVDDGAVRYRLGRREHAADRSVVTVLPPGVPHDGRAATPAGFRKRVVYLEPDAVTAFPVGAGVDRPDTRDPVLHRLVGRLHTALQHAGDALEAEALLLLVDDRLAGHVPPGPRSERPDPALADRLRRLLDEHVVDGLGLADAAARLGADPGHLVRAFGRAFGITPHRYLLGRRLDLARTLLLAGRPPAEVAVEAGFHDQPHLTRHFKRFLGVTPGGYATAVSRA